MTTDGATPPEQAIVPAHEPAPPEKQILIPDRDMLIRGIGFLALGAGLIAGGLQAGRASRLLGLILVPATFGASVLSLWAAVIHLTGGEKFDDHPFV